MKSFPIICCIALCWACAHDKDIFDPEALKKYTESFRNRSEIKVDITSEYEGAFYSVFYQYPYEEESLVKTPALTGRTPIHTTLQVPHDVDRLYIIGNGELHESDVKDLYIHDGGQTKAATTNPIPGEVLTVINSQYFPEATNNVRGEDLFKCTDLVIAETESTGDFNEAEVWMTFIGDGGSRGGGIYGKCWFYTYPSEKMGDLRKEDCTFYGLVNGEIKPVDYEEVIHKQEDNYIFYTKEEIVNGVSSYKKYKLGAFPKGVNVGFVYYSGKSGKTVPQFTTPRLNEKVDKFTLNYSTGGSFQITNKYLANGFIRHIKVGDFEGNVLGLENRSVDEKVYDGDYNDMLCLIESNPLALKPVEPIDPPIQDEFKMEEGIYLFEDNYPRSGDFDFNDVVVQYQIIDFYNSSNGAKQLTATLLAKGASYTNVFGFRVDGKYIPLLKDLKGYQNVGENESFRETGMLVTQTVYAKEVKPYLYNGEGYICDENYNTGRFPYVLEIPISDPDDDSWKFFWCREGKSIDEAYYFLKSKDGGERVKSWYKEFKDEMKVFKR